MLLPPYHLKASFLPFEKRLLYKTPQVEILKTQAIDMLRQENSSEQQFDATAVAIQKSQDEKNIMQSIGESLKRLQPKEQAIASINFKRLEEKIRLKAETKDAQRTLAEQVQDLHPANWSPETVTTVRNVAAGTLVAGVGGFVLYQLWKKFWGKSKEVAKDTVEKAKNGFSWLTGTLLIGGALAIAGVAYHWPKIQKFMQTYADVKKTELQLREQIAKLDEQIQKGKELGQEGLAEIEKQRKQLMDELAELKKQKITPPQQAPPPPKDASKPKEAPEPGATTIKDVVEKKGEAVKENLSQEIMTRYLVAFEDSATIPWPAGENAESNQRKVQDILLMGTNNANLKMKDLFACVAGGRFVDRTKLTSVLPPPVSKETNPEAFAQYLCAAELIVRACARHRGEMDEVHQKSAAEKTPLGELSLRQYLEQMGGTNAAILNLRDEIKNNIKQYNMDPEHWNIEKIVAAIGADPLVSQDLVQELKNSKTLQALYQKNGTLKETVDGFSYTSVLNFLEKQPLGINPSASLAGIEGALSNAANNGTLTPDQHMDLAMSNALLEITKANLPTAAQLQPFFHQIFPKHSWKEPETLDEKKNGISVENEQIINDYLRSTMTFAQTARFALYMRMMKRGNPAGVVLMQAEILKFIREEEPRELTNAYLKTRMYESGVNLTNKLLDGEFLNALSAVIPAIDDRMKARIQKMTEALIPTALKTGAGALGTSAVGILEPIVGTAKRYPKISSSILATTAGYVVGKGVSRVINWRINRTNFNSLEEILRHRATETWQRNALTETDIRISTDTYSDAGDQIQKINEKISEIRRIDKRVSDPVRAAYRECLKNGATDDALAELHRTITSTHSPNPAAAKPLNELADEIDVLMGNNNKEIREAIRVSIRPIRTSILRYTIPAGLQAVGIGFGVMDFLEGRALGKEEEKVKAQGHEELADALWFKKMKKYGIDVPSNVGSGAAFYYAQKMALKRFGNIPFRGPIAPRAAGTLGGLGLMMAIEGLRMEAQHILDSREENLRDLALTSEQTRELPKQEIVKKLQEYTTGKLSWDQFHRRASAARWYAENTPEEIARESNNIRDAYFDGFLFQRLAVRAEGGDTEAVDMLNRMFVYDEKKKNYIPSPDSIKIWNRYVDSCQDYLEKKASTRNDLALLGKGQNAQGLERTLREADRYAALQSDIFRYYNLMNTCDSLYAELEKRSERFRAIRDEIAASDSPGQIQPLIQERTKLQTEMDELSRGLDNLSDELTFLEQIKITQADGSIMTIPELAIDEEGKPKNPDTTALIKQSSAYDAGKRILMQSLESTQEAYEPFVKHAQSIYDELSTVGIYGKGAWYPTEHTYNRMLEYGYLLDRFPQFDHNGAVREAIWSLPSLNWTLTRIPTGDHHYQKLFEFVRTKIKENVAATKSQRLRLLPEQQKKKPAEVSEEKTVHNIIPPDAPFNYINPRLFTMRLEMGDGKVVSATVTPNGDIDPKLQKYVKMYYSPGQKGWRIRPNDHMDIQRYVLTDVVGDGTKTIYEVGETPPAPLETPELPEAEPSPKDYSSPSDIPTASTT